MAARNRLTTQVGALDCQRDGRWVLADVSRTEWLEKEADAGFGAPFADAPARLKLIAPLRSLLTSGPPKDTRAISAVAAALTACAALEAALLLDDWARGAAPAPVLLALSSAISRSIGAWLGVSPAARSKRLTARWLRGAIAGLARQAKYKLVGVSEPQWNTAWSIPLPLTRSRMPSSPASTRAARSPCCAAC